MALPPHKALPPQKPKVSMSLMSRKASEKEVRKEGKV